MNEAAQSLQGSTPPADNQGMIRADRVWHLAIAALVLGGVASFARDQTGGATTLSLTMQFVGWASIIVAVKRARTLDYERRLPWMWFSGGYGMFLMGNLALLIQQELSGAPPPLPSVADPFFIAGYIGVAAGGMKLIRLRTDERVEHVVLDALILAIAVGVAEWAYVIAPIVHSGYMNVSQQALTIGYAAFDLLVIGVIARLAVGTGARLPSYYFMAGSIAGVVGFDISFTLFLTGQAPEWITPVMGMGAFALFAAAAAHPTMPRLAEPAPARSTKLTRRRIALLVTAMLVAPAVLALEWWRDNPFAVVGAVGGWVILAGLVMARMTDLVRVKERQARRDQILSRANVAFMASEDHKQMYQVAMAGARALVAGEKDVRVSLLLGTTDALMVISSAGLGALQAGARYVNTYRLMPELAEALENRKSISLASSYAPDLSRRTGIPSAVVLAPLVARNELRGAITISTSKQVDAHTFHGIEMLAGQFSLALGSAELTEERHRVEHESRFTELIENARDLVAVLDADMRFTFVSASARGMLGYEPSQLVGTLLSDIIHPDNQTSVVVLAKGTVPGTRRQSETRVRVSSGSWVTLDMRFTHLKDESIPGGFVLNARDVTERCLLEEELSRKAHVDSLTAMPNRMELVRRATEILGVPDESGTGFALIWVDVDDFKTFNGSLGFHLASQVIVLVGDRIQSCVGEADTAARISGDNFAVLLTGASSEEEVIEMVKDVLHKVSTPMTVSDHDLSVTATAGVALDLAREFTPDELLHRAELAKHEAKTHGGNCFELFEESMVSEVVERLDLKSDLTRAVEMQQFRLEYQPVVDIRNGELEGFEALSRWPHPSRGVIMPVSFIPLIESTGMVVPFGRWVIDEACKQLHHWETLHPERSGLSMNVNVSARQLREQGFVDEVARILDYWEVKPSSLVLEITESMLMTNDPITAQSIIGLKGVGVKLAIDDFGTGYSSLGYVRRFPVDIIKIDRSFVSPMGGETDVAITHTIVDLAAQIGARTVAEGVETLEQLAAIRESGCEFAQGYYFAKSMSGDEATKLVASFDHTPFARMLSEPVAP